MNVDDFVQHSRVLYVMTRDFVRAVPEDRWEFSPLPAGSSGRPPAEFRLGDGFGTFSHQVRHVVCVRGVYNEALAAGTLDWSLRDAQYRGPLEPGPLLEALEQKQERLVSLLGDVDPQRVIDWGGFPFSMTMFAGEFVQHEAIHHGQWSVYAALAGFDTPLSWRQSWGL